MDDIRSLSKELLVYGHGIKASRFIRAAKMCGFSIIGRYHQNVFLNCISKNRKSKAEFLHIAKSRQLPIVITNRNSDPFSKNISYIRNSLNLTNHILHPIFLSDFYKPKIERYYIRGFPGSGNMAFQNIIEGIINSASFKKAIKPDWLHRRMVHYAHIFWHNLTQEIISLFKNFEVSSYYTSPKYMNTASLGIHLHGKEPGFPQINRLPCNAYVWHGRWGGDHSPLTSESIDFFHRHNYHTIQLLRHPLDILISNANKAASLSNDIFKVGSASNDCLHKLLNNKEWFTEILKQLTEYGRLIVENQHRVCLVKYEDLMAKPLETIQKLSTSMGSTLPISECDIIWKTVDGVKLNSYWNPGSNKWKRYLSSSHKEAILTSGIIDIAKKLGYEIDLNELPSTYNAEVDMQISDSELYMFALREALDHKSNVGKKTTFQHPNVITQNISGTSLDVICHKHDYEKIESHLATSLMKDMLNASRIMPPTHAIDAYEYFHGKT